MPADPWPYAIRHGVDTLNAFKHSTTEVVPFTSAFSHTPPYVHHMRAPIWVPRTVPTANGQASHLRVSGTGCSATAARRWRSLPHPDELRTHTEQPCFLPGDFVPLFFRLGNPDLHATCSDGVDENPPPLLPKDFGKTVHECGGDGEAYSSPRSVNMAHAPGEALSMEELNYTPAVQSKYGEEKSDTDTSDAESQNWQGSALKSVRTETESQDDDTETVHALRYDLWPNARMQYSAEALHDSITTADEPSLRKALHTPERSL